MREKSRQSVLILTFTCVTLLITLITFYNLYTVSFQETQNRLRDIAKVQARLIESVAAYNQLHGDDERPGGAVEVTLGQVEASMGKYDSLGATGEVTLARLEGERVAFLIPRRLAGYPKLLDIHMGTKLAIPMQQALSGASGVITASDYAGIEVLAAYEPVKVLNLGLVAKIDIEEVRAPFYRAGGLSLAGLLVFVFLGSLIFLRITNPMIDKMEYSEEQHRSIVANAVDSIITIDVYGTIESFNPAAEKLLGYKAAEVIGKSVNMLMPQPHAGLHEEYIRNFLVTGEKKIIGIGREVNGLHKKGYLVPFDLGVSELRLRGRRIFTAILHDITERKKVELMKNEFVSTVSHELRTPLTSIMGSLSMLLSEIAGKLEEQPRGLIEIAHRNGEHLLLLINDILDIEKIEAGKMEFNFAELDLEPFIARAVESNQSYAIKHEVNFTIGSTVANVTVRADEHRLLQVFANLLSNAAKFSPAGKEVAVTSRLRGDLVRIDIRDQGPGIPESFREQIFDRFSQADLSSSYNFSGTGLGLSIAKAIIEKHGGNVGFDSAAGQGSCFFFELPVLPSSGGKKEPDAGSLPANL